MEGMSKICATPGLSKENTGMSPFENSLLALSNPTFESLKKHTQHGTEGGA
jgi:hypothetical protein